MLVMGRVRLARHEAVLACIDTKEALELQGQTLERIANSTKSPATRTQSSRLLRLATANSDAFHCFCDVLLLLVLDVPLEVANECGGHMGTTHKSI